MKTKLLIFGASTLLLLPGCVTNGLSPHEVAGSTYANYILNLPRTNATNAPHQLAKPLRLAVAQVGESAPPKTMVNKLESNSACIASVVQLPASGEANPPYYYRQQETNLQTKREDFGNRVESLRQLSQQLGAEYLFICGGDMSWNNPNLFHVFDITIVGGMILPSTKINLEGRAAGVLIHAASGEPIFTLSTEAARSKYSASFFVGDRTNGQRVQLRNELTAALADELLEKISTPAN